MKKHYNISIPFLATNFKQMLIENDSSCLEATVFNREDLENESWELIWHNIGLAQQIAGNDKVTFHFPVNNSDYVADLFVRNRLFESLQRSSDLGLHGVVVHSNRIRSLNEWMTLNLEEERQQVIDTLLTIRAHYPSQTWLALENMPVMDNYCLEIDPLFCYPKDFKNLLGESVGIVWDLCHFTNTIATIQEVLEGKQDAKYYPNLHNCSYSSFSILKNQIRHWHFSAFQGIPNPYTGEQCREGVLPNESTLGEGLYNELWNEMCYHLSQDQHVVLEISETNYEQRTKVKQMIEWIKLR